MIKVKLTAQLRDWTGGQSELDMDSPSNLKEVFKKLNAAFPGINQRILDDEGRLRTTTGQLFVGRDHGQEWERITDGLPPILSFSVSSP